MAFAKHCRGVFLSNVMLDIQTETGRDRKLEQWETYTRSCFQNKLRQVKANYKLRIEFVKLTSFVKTMLRLIEVFADEFFSITQR